MISMIVYVHDGITRRLMRIENDLSRISDLAAKKNISVTDEFFKAEISKLESYSDFNSNGLIRVLKTFQSLITTEQKLKSFEATSGLARQVAHDIRSPLSALDVVLATSQGLPEDKRHLARSAITRIKDIANDLLKQNPKPIAESTEASTKSVHLISTLLEDIVSEKRLQYRSLLEAEIDFDLNEDSYGLFAEVDAVEFRRIISNLVNNAVEALPSQKGSVSLSLKSVGSRIVCEIHDTGKGIPSHLLPKLGRQGVSFGKEGTRSGSGLGLYHAIHTIEKWGGKIDIETEEARGTSVFIHLNRVEAPKWFCEKLEIKKGARVIVVDDDASIHRIWENRLQPQTFRKDIEVVHFSLPDAFATWLRDHRSDQDLYLIDYEFLGKTKTGLDLIQEMDIVRQSVLVTSRHEEPEVLARAEKMAIGLVPKAIAGIAPLHISESPSSLNLPCVLERPDAILIDDDNLVRTVWQTWAEDHGKQIRCYSDFNILWAELKNFDKSTVIYIDSNLGVEKSGEDLAKMLFDQGFTNIYLSTGFEGSAFKNVSHLKGIVGKEPDAAFAITAR
jgi:signal transduction histidine kinase